MFFAALLLALTIFLLNAILVQLGLGSLSAIGGGAICDIWQDGTVKLLGVNPNAHIHVPAIGLLVGGVSLNMLLTTLNFGSLVFYYGIYELFMKTYDAPLMVAVQSSLHPKSRDVGLGFLLFTSGLVGGIVSSLVGIQPITTSDKLPFCVPFCCIAAFLLMAIAPMYSKIQVSEDGEVKVDDQGVLGSGQGQMEENSQLLAGRFAR
eukprot:FR742107.1.p1 GENE.FR742107.1~~FR742107.1.p1  ORF type:complete len:206 (+),score=26.33 FR742107.1:1-618(+)